MKEKNIIADIGRNLVEIDSLFDKLSSSDQAKLCKLLGESDTDVFTLLYLGHKILDMSQIK